MPIKRTQLKTGVASNVIKKLLQNEQSAQAATMSQEQDFELDLNELEQQIAMAVGEEEAGPAEPPALEESAQVEQAAEEDTPAAQAVGEEEAAPAEPPAAPAEPPAAVEPTEEETPAAQEEPAPPEQPAAEEPAATSTDEEPASASSEPAEAASPPNTNTAPPSKKKAAFAKPTFAKPSKAQDAAADTPPSGGAGASKPAPARTKKLLLLSRAATGKENALEDQPKPVKPTPVARKPAAIKPKPAAAEEDAPEDKSASAPQPQPSKPKPAKPTAASKTLKLAAPKPAADDEEEAAEGSPPKPKAAKPKPAAPKAKPAAPKPKSKPAAEEGGSEGAAKIKRAKNAYMFFVEANRAKVKADNPGCSMGEQSKLLGTMWGALGNEDKAPYQALAEADKERYMKERADAGIADGPKQPKAPKAGAKKAAVQSAFELYCAEQRPALAGDNPTASAGDLQRLLVDGWRKLDDLDKSVYEAQHEELKQASKAPTKKRAAAAANGSPPKKQKRGGKRKGKQAVASEEDSDGEMANAQDASDDEEAERENCDYNAFPAEHIISKTANGKKMLAGKFLVARKGKGLTAYGLVDAQSAKMQRLGQGSGDMPCPVSLEMLEEWEAFEKGFKRAVHDNSEGGELVLESVADGSPLEACFFLGQLRQPNYDLSKAAKGDMMMKVPLLATCRTVQRLLDIERRTAEDWKARALSAEAMLEGVAAAGAGKGAGRPPSTGTRKRLTGES
ncbi:hypothetical protein N2152v2_011135 [Parachlorella kessleri]